MRFDKPLLCGTLIKRYKRFLADVELSDGQHVTAHCPNTGAMTGCAEPGFQVWLSQSDNPKRKLAYTWELAVDFAGHWIGINTHNANKLAEQAILSGCIAPLCGYAKLAREVKYGNEGSRIDLLLSEPGRHFIEVKSVTLQENSQGYFPDAKTQRGTKHLRELIGMVEQGAQASLLFCAQHTGIQSVQAAQHIDPEYAQLLAQAKHKGVQILAYGCHLSPEKIEINHRLPFTG